MEACFVRHAYIDSPFVKAECGATDADRKQKVAQQRYFFLIWGYKLLMWRMSTTNHMLFLSHFDEKAFIFSINALVNPNTLKSKTPCHGFFPKNFSFFLLGYLFELNLG